MATDDLSGYTKLPGSARRYRTPSGEIISRRQYENIKFEKQGWRSWGEYQREAKSEEYRRFARQYRKHTGKRPDTEFKEQYRKAKRSKFSPKVGSSFDRFLKFIGYRKPEADYQVGDTPGGYSSK